MYIKLIQAHICVNMKVYVSVWIHISIFIHAYVQRTKTNNSGKYIWRYCVLKFVL